MNFSNFFQKPAGDSTVITNNSGNIGIGCNNNNNNNNNISNGSSNSSINRSSIGLPSNMQQRSTMPCLNEKLPLLQEQHQHHHQNHNFNAGQLQHSQHQQQQVNSDNLTSMRYCCK